MKLEGGTTLDIEKRMEKQKRVCFGNRNPVYVYDRLPLLPYDLQLNMSLKFLVDYLE